MTVELKVNLPKIFGAGSIQGSAGSLQRYLSQTDNGDGEIRIDGQLKTLSEAESELSSHLSTDVSMISKIIATSTYSDQSLSDTFTLEIVL